MAFFASLAPAVAAVLGLVSAGCRGTTDDSRPSLLAVDAGAPLRDASPAIDSSSSCGDTASDPKNCGACGRACLRGACQAGVCDPLPVTVLASGQQSPVALVVDESNVYWRNAGQSTGQAKAPGPNVNGQIMECTETGCADAPTVLAGAIEMDSYPNLAIDDGSVYWSQVEGDAGPSSRVVTCAKSGCGGSPRDTTPGGVGLLAVDSLAVYWSTSDGEILRCPSGGCAGSPAPILAGPSPDVITAIALDDTNVYWGTGSGNVLFCPKGGCGASPTPLGSYDPRAAAFALDANTVYWVRSDPLSLGEIMVCPKRGCALPTILVSSLSSATSIATDGTNVYWGELGDSATVGGVGLGRVAMCAVAGCDDHPTTLAAGLDYPVAIAVDTANVYFATTGAAPGAGAIQMIAK